MRSASHIYRRLLTIGLIGASGAVGSLVTRSILSRELRADKQSQFDNLHTGTDAITTKTAHSSLKNVHLDDKNLANSLEAYIKTCNFGSTSPHLAAFDEVKPFTVARNVDLTAIASEQRPVCPYPSTLSLQYHSLASELRLSMESAAYDDYTFESRYTPATLPIVSESARALINSSRSNIASIPHSWISPQSKAGALELIVIAEDLATSQMAITRQHNITSQNQTLTLTDTANKSCQLRFPVTTYHKALIDLGDSLFSDTFSVFFRNTISAIKTQIETNTLSKEKEERNRILESNVIELETLLNDHDLRHNYDLNTDPHYIRGFLSYLAGNKHIFESDDIFNNTQINKEGLSACIILADLHDVIRAWEPLFSYQVQLWEPLRDVESTAVEIATVANNTVWYDVGSSACTPDSFESWTYQKSPYESYQPDVFEAEYVLIKAQEFASAGLIDLGIQMASRGLHNHLVHFEASNTDAIQSSLDQAVAPGGLLNLLWASNTTAEPAQEPLQAAVILPDQEGTKTVPRPAPVEIDDVQKPEQGNAGEAMEYDRSSPYEFANGIHKYFNASDNLMSRQIVPLSLTAQVVRHLAATQSTDPQSIAEKLPSAYRNAIKNSLDRVLGFYEPLGQVARMQWLRKTATTLGVHLPKVTQQPMFSRVSETPKSLTLLLGRSKVVIEHTHVDQRNKIAKTMEKLWTNSAEFRQAFAEARIGQDSVDQVSVNEIVSESPFRIVVEDIGNAGGEISGTDKVEMLRLSPGTAGHPWLERTLVHELTHNLQPGVVRDGYEATIQPTLSKSKGPHNRDQTLMITRLLRDLNSAESGELHDYSNDSFSCGVAALYSEPLLQLLSSIADTNVTAGVNTLVDLPKDLLNIKNTNPQVVGHQYPAHYDTHLSVSDALMQHTLLVIMDADSQTDKAPYLSSAKAVFTAYGQTSDLAKQEAQSAWRLVIGTDLFD